MRRGTCSTARSRSTPTTPRLWLEARPTTLTRFNGWGDPGTDYDAKVLGQANRAIISPPTIPAAYTQRRSIWPYRADTREALGAADAGLAVNPNYPLLYQARAIAETSLGRFEQAKADLERAMQLSPRDPYFGGISRDPGRRGDQPRPFRRGDRRISQGDRLGLSTYFVYTNLAAAYAQAGKMDEAKADLAEARRLNPAITVKWMKEHSPNLPAVFDGLRKAGMPEE